MGGSDGTQRRSQEPRQSTASSKQASGRSASSLITNYEEDDSDIDDTEASNEKPMGLVGQSHARKERIEAAEEDDMVLLGTAMLTQPILDKTENLMTNTMSTFAAEDSLEVSDVSLPDVRAMPSST